VEQRGRYARKRHVLISSRKPKRRAILEDLARLLRHAAAIAALFVEAVAVSNASPRRRAKF